MSQNSSRDAGPAGLDWGRPAVGPSPIERVLLCDVLGPREAGYEATATSLPGHLVQLTREGETVHEIEGRRYRVSAGSLVWFHEDELVRLAVERDWSFFTLNFIAPALAPPPFDRRVRRVGEAARVAFDALLAAWRDEAAPAAEREMRVHARLLDLLGAAWPAQAQPWSMDPRAALWWRLETRVREDLSRPVDLATLVRWSGRSQATIARAARAAVDMPPMKRIKQVRLGLARGLVLHSDLQVNEIAARVGYGRVHELSRDYAKRFGRPPTQERG